MHRKCAYIHFMEPPTISHKVKHYGQHCEYIYTYDDLLMEETTDIFHFYRSVTEFNVYTSLFKNSSNCCVINLSYVL